MAQSQPIRLSVLDQSPVPSGTTPAQALANSLSLAQHADALGYHRLWYSEHHAMPLLACSAPELLIARAAAATQRIRVGSGGIMLQHYSPFKVAELFSTLAAMFPSRIDLGLGRAPGGGQLESLALRRDRSAPPLDDFPHQLAELRAYLDPTRWNDLAPNHPFRKLRVAPHADIPPEIWLLGSSMWSSVNAAHAGLPYAFAHFFSPLQTRQAIEFYRHNFTPPTTAGAPDRSHLEIGASTASQRTANKAGAPGLDSEAWVSRELHATTATPQPTLCIGVICADTDAEAHHLHASVRLLQRRIRMDDRRPLATPKDALLELNDSPAAPNPLIPFTAGSFDAPEEGEWPRYLVGTPDRVATQLRSLAHELELSEILINTITHSHQARLHSYTLLAKEMGL